jgi:hypothetical protein
MRDELRRPKNNAAGKGGLSMHSSFIVHRSSFNALCARAATCGLVGADNWRAIASIWRANTSIWRANASIWRANACIWRANASIWRAKSVILPDSRAKASKSRASSTNWRAKAVSSRSFCHISKGLREWRAKNYFPRPFCHILKGLRERRAGKRPGFSAARSIEFKDLQWILLRRDTRMPRTESK